MRGPHRHSSRPFATHPSAVGVAAHATALDAPAGAFYVDAEEQPRVLHLAWHYLLRDEELVDASDFLGGSWAAPPLDPDRADALAAFFELVSDTHLEHGLPYALHYVRKSRFLASGQLRLARSTHGFTCSTFLLALFYSGGCRLLRAGAWRERDGDLEVQRKLVDTLRRYRADKQHVRIVEQEIGCARYRPTDLVGAAACEALPASFEDATTMGEAVAAQLR